LATREVFFDKTTVVE